MRRSATNQTSDSRRAGRIPRAGRPAGGFTLLELVAAITLFALIIVYVLADREDSLRMSADARIIQTVQYLAGAKIDEIRHDPDAYSESEGGDFEELENDWQKFTDYTWELQIERVVVVGKSDDGDATYLFPDDEEEVAPEAAEGRKLTTRLLRRLTLTVRYEPGGEDRTDLDVIIRTFLPPSADDEAKPEAGP
jgi:prepilin-type N-terminal cleavage/methylation domain-containing protein